MLSYNAPIEAGLSFNITPQKLPKGVKLQNHGDRSLLSVRPSLRVLCDMWHRFVETTCLELYAGLQKSTKKTDVKVGA